MPDWRSLRWHGLLLLWIVALIGSIASPSAAHKKNNHQQTEEVRQQQGTPGGQTPAAVESGPTAENVKMGEMMGDMAADRSAMSVGERLLDWLGRLHPSIVHFPIAFFPAALFTAIVGRRRPAFAAPVQFLVVAGGIVAPIAALFGWFDAMRADPDPLLTFHRWLGTGIGIGGLFMAIWAWRRPVEVRSAGMTLGLTLMTTAIVIQGWFGAALVHGIDHMNW